MYITLYYNSQVLWGIQGTLPNSATLQILEAAAVTCSWCYYSESGSREVAFHCKHCGGNISVLTVSGLFLVFKTHNP